MQPYVFPYLGYFQLIKATDVFILLDTVKFIKGGWINRNMLSSADGPQRFTLPVKTPTSSRSLIADVELHEAERYRKKFFKTVSQLYRSAPNFASVYQLLQRAYTQGEANLTKCLEHMLQVICQALDINTPIYRASTRYVSDMGQGQARVIEICRREEATTYINAEGGVALYDPRSFADHGIALRFLRHLPCAYHNNAPTFYPRLSIVDLMMFNNPATISDMLQRYELFEGR